jgi:hypothetical protein
VSLRQVSLDKPHCHVIRFRATVKLPLTEGSSLDQGESQAVAKNPRLRVWTKRRQSLTCRRCLFEASPVSQSARSISKTRNVHRLWKAGKAVERFLVETATTYFVGLCGITRSLFSCAAFKDTTGSPGRPSLASELVISGAEAHAAAAQVGAGR